MKLFAAFIWFYLRILPNGKGEIRKKANTMDQEKKNETKTDLHSERIILTLAACVFTFHKQTLKNQLWQQ